MTIQLGTARRLAMGVAVPLALLAATASSQVPAGDPRWEAWQGCWQSVPAVTSPDQSRALVCVTPLATGSAIEIATIANGNVVARDTLDASGVQRKFAPAGCTGWQSGEWSRDARRVYMRSEIACGTTMKRASTGLLAMSAHDEWLDVQSVNANGNAGVRTTRYIEVGPGFVDLPAEFSNVISGRARMPYAARTLAGSPIAPPDVIEASSHLDSLVVAAWLVERGQKFDINARALLAMANAGVPGSVTDMMIGVSFPQRFAVAQQSAQPQIGGAPAVQPAGGLGLNYGSNYGVMERNSWNCFNANLPLWYTRYDYDPCLNTYGYGQYGYGYGYGRYGYDPYGYGYGYGYPGYYGYGNYGYYGRPTSAGYQSPVVVARPEEPPHGRVIKGQGYTRGSAGASQPDPLSEFRGASSSSSGSSSSGGAAGRTSSGSSSGGSSSGSSGSSSSSGRTAQARPPGGGKQ